MQRDAAFWLFSFAGGGAESATIRLVNALARQGVSVDLLVSRADGPLRSAVAPAVRVVVLNKNSKTSTAPSIIRYILVEQPRTICLERPLGYLLAVAVRIARIRTQVWVLAQSTRTDRQAAQRGQVSMKATGRWKRRILRAYASVAEWLFRGAPTGMIAISHTIKQELLDDGILPQNRIHVVYNAIIERISNWTDDMPIKQVNVPQNKYIMSMGRLEDQKDFKTLLKAFCEVHTKCDVNLDYSW